MITIYRVPEQQAELDAFKVGKVHDVDYHELHNPFENFYEITTGEHMPPVVQGE